MSAEQSAEAAQVRALQAQLEALRSECAEQSRARVAAEAEADRLRERVVSLEVRLAASESGAAGVSRRGLAALITPPAVRREA